MKKTELSSEAENKQLLEIYDKPKSYLESVKGIIAVLSVVILYTASATCVQLLERRIPDFELNMFRSGIPLIFYVIGLMMMQRWPMIDRSEIVGTVLYSLAGSNCKMGEFVAVTFLPAATVSCLFSTSSITFGLPLFALLLKETVTVRKIMLAVMCVCGVILVVQPWMELRTYHDDLTDRGNLSVHGTGYVNNAANFRFGHQEFTVHGKTTTSTVNFTKESIGTGLVSKIVGYTAAVSGGFLLSTEVVIIKRNPCIGEHIMENVFWGRSTNTAVSLILMFIVETPVLPSNWFDVSMVTIHSATCGAIWPLMIYQTKTIAGNTATLILSTQVVFMISQYTVLSSILPGHRNWMEVVGVVLVLFGSSFSSLLDIVFDKRST